MRRVVALRTTDTAALDFYFSCLTTILPRARRTAAVPGNCPGTGQRGDRPGRRHRRGAKQQDLDSVIRRIKTLTAQVSGSAGHEEAPAAQPQRQPHTEARRVNDFLPVEPESFRGAGLTETMVESLVLKFLLARGDSSGREIADQVKLPFILIDELLRSLKSDQMVTLRGSAAMNDFQYQLSDLGRERARRYRPHCTYFGAAPVSLPDYVASVKAQTLAGQQPKAEHLAEAFADLLLSRQLLDRLGPAINSGRGLFLYGRRATARPASPSG